MSFSECVIEKVSPDCSLYRMWLQIPFFCGQASPCWEEGSNWALQQAKYNLLNEYFLVGLNEQMEKFIQLLDHQLPHVFKVSVKCKSYWAGFFEKILYGIVPKPLISSEALNFEKQSQNYYCHLKLFELQHLTKPKMRPILFLMIFYSRKINIFKHMQHIIYSISYTK